MSKKPNKLSEQLRAVILSADKTRYRIAQETGLTQAGLSRFVNRVCGLSLESIDLIGQCLDLKITVRTPAKRKVKKRKGK